MVPHRTLEVAKPIQIIDGAWSRHSVPGKKPVPTGNFSFTIAGDVPFQDIILYTPYFIKVLLKGVLVPGEKWMFVHAIGVPTKNSDGVLHSCEALTEEVQRNPIFHDVILCAKVHWRGNVATVAGCQSAAAIIVYADRSGMVIPALHSNGLTMFGSRVRCDVLGESPKFH